MEKIIIHLEWDGEAIHKRQGVKATPGLMYRSLDHFFESVRANIGEDIGWRYFTDLEGAVAWEARGELHHGY